MNPQRLEHLIRFYSILDQLELRIGGARRLRDCTGLLDWPKRGIYFFREPGELRTDTGTGPRIVRVGTHALKTGAATTLWKRLSQHKGRSKSGGGNHRGSIFRLFVGTALMDRDSFQSASWDQDKSTDAGLRNDELTLERHVSKVIGAMPFLWLAIDDEAGPNSKRGYIERNSIALLSNYKGPPIDPPSDKWLGRYCNRDRVQRSGLWNFHHVDQDYDPSFLDLLQKLVEACGQTKHELAIRLRQRIFGSFDHRLTATNRRLLQH